MAHNMQLKLIDAAWLCLINTVSFFLAIFAVGVAYCEFRKKELAVMKVLGQKPMRVIYRLSFMNIALTAAISLFFNPFLSVVCGLEIVIYMFIIYLYYSKKSVTVLKGQ